MTLQSDNLYYFCLMFEIHNPFFCFQFLCSKRFLHFILLFLTAICIAVGKKRNSMTANAKVNILHSIRPILTGAKRSLMVDHLQRKCVLRSK